VFDMVGTAGVRPAGDFRDGAIGSSVGYIALVHDRRVRAGDFSCVHVFCGLVSQGMTTNHVWEGLRHEVSVEELREFWAPISPMPYVERGMGSAAEYVYGVREVRSDVFAGADTGDAEGFAEKWSGDRTLGIAGGALFAGAGAVSVYVAGGRSDYSIFWRRWGRGKRDMSDQKAKKRAYTEIAPTRSG